MLTPINDIQARATKGQPTPTVGMGATILMHSDRHAATITEVQTDRNGTMRVAVQRDTAKVVRGSGHDGSAVYEFEPNTNGYVEWFQMRPGDARWTHVVLNEATKRWNKARGSGLRIGERDEYYDPSF